MRLISLSASEKDPGLVFTKPGRIFLHWLSGLYVSDVRLFHFFMTVIWSSMKQRKVYNACKRRWSVIRKETTHQILKTEDHETTGPIWTLKPNCMSLFLTGYTRDKPDCDELCWYRHNYCFFCAWRGGRWVLLNCNPHLVMYLLDFCLIACLTCIKCFIVCFIFRINCAHFLPVHLEINATGFNYQNEDEKVTLCFPSTLQNGKELILWPGRSLLLSCQQSLCNELL